MARVAHGDRGDGTCGVCYEEAPCAVQRGEKERGGIQEAADDHLLEWSLQQSLLHKDRTDRINEWFKRHGLDVEWSDFATGQMIDAETMLSIIAIAEGTEWE